MGKIESAYRSCRQHGEALRQRNTGVLFDLQEFEEQLLFGMVRACRIPGRGTDPPILFPDQVFTSQILFLPIPPFGSDPFMEIFGKGFGESIGQRFGHNRIVIVMIFVELPA